MGKDEKIPGTDEGTAPVSIYSTLTYSLLFYFS